MPPSFPRTCGTTAPRHHDTTPHWCCRRRRARITHKLGNPTVKNRHDWPLRVTTVTQKTSLRNHVLPLFPFAPAAPRHHDTTPHWCCRRRRRRRPNPPKATPPTLDVSRDRSHILTSFRAQHTNKHNKPKPDKPRAAAQAPLYQIPFRVWCNQSSQV
jgi:hypothetical protein